MSRIVEEDYRTAFLRSLPALNRGTLAAGMRMALPVWGFRPFRAARLATENVPKPTNVTFFPLLRESRIDFRVLSRAVSAAFLVIPEAFAITATSPALVISSHLLSLGAIIERE